MRVQVDDARHQHEPVSIDDLGRVFADLADRGDAAILDRNVGADRVVPKPVDHGGTADHEVMHPLLLALDVLYRRRMICIAPFGLGDYHVALHASIGLIRPKMDQPQSADLTLGSLQAKGTETEPDAIGEFENVQAERIAAGRLVVSDKSLGLQRPQNVVRGAAMETGEARDLAGIQRPLRAVQDAQHFCRRDDRAYRFARIAPDEFSGAESLLAVLRRSGLMDLARPLMHAISDAHGVSVYVSKVQGPSSLLLLDWVGVAFRTDLYVTVGRPSPVPAGASGVIMAAFGGSSEPELEALFSQVAWYQKPSFAEFLARVKEAKRRGFAAD